MSHIDAHLNTDSGVLPLLDTEARPQSQGESELESKLAEARRTLEAEVGLPTSIEHVKRPAELPFTADQRERTTLLFGGLTWKHETLIQGALEGMGYRCEELPTPDVKAFQTGKEYGNNGQCNPTYFTVGNLVQYLKSLESQGFTRQEIIDQYVFFTAGACGPCRFGMYEAEFRLALRNSGFEGFRVILFQQNEGLDQSEIEAGLVLDVDFFMAFLNSTNIADLVNELAHQIRPYESVPGDTDRVLDEVMDDLHEVMRSKKRFELSGRFGKLLRWLPGLEGTATAVGKFLDQLNGDEYVDAMVRARERFDGISLDRFRVKPVVKVTGEFWAQTTEGDGNFNMFEFLERENSEILVEPVATWIVYMIHGAQNSLKDRKGLAEGMIVPTWRSPIRRILSEWRAGKLTKTLSLARVVFTREYNRLRSALGGTAHELVDQLKMERIAHPFYNSRAQGGEGHLEVAKNIYYHNNDLCHMVLCLKPFGCMPSTQSDGAQAAVMSHFPEMIYLPIETSGEGEINAHSRVQMALGEARTKARQEFARALEKGGYPLSQLRSYVDKHPELKHGTFHVPPAENFVGTAARMALHISSLLQSHNVRPEGSVLTDLESLASPSPDLLQGMSAVGEGV
ncbi:MAG: hypothetical protein QGH20_05550, partial [Candidatus Latescibacteria bacterium]|nr:hypothetical protein [Candidatus Latescibacterota bacterium]